MRYYSDLASIKRIRIIASKLVESFFSGNYRSVFRGPGIEFDEFRSYMYGDDVRLIDWNVTSRTGFPYVKVFREERELSLFFLLDLSASMIYGSGERSKIEVAGLTFAILTLSAAINNDKFGALFFTDRIEKWVPMSKGKKHALSLIDDIFWVEPQGRGSDLKMAVKSASQLLKKRSICVIISDFKTDNYWHELSILSKKHDVIAVKVWDDNDISFPTVGLIRLQDPERGEEMYAYGLSEEFRNSYRRFWMAKHRKWKRNCFVRGVNILEINTSMDVGAELFKFFRRRKRA